MKNRYLILGLSAFLAVAFAVPALGGPSNPIADGAASAKKTAKKALKKAKKANRKAKSAQSSANSAQSSANSAQASADSAQSTADGAASAAATAQTTADGAQTTANGAQTTANGAQTTADGAQTAAEAAQASADAAQATANSKYGSITHVEGDPSPTTNADKGVVFAVCPSGRDLSGGGYIVSGAGNENARVTFNTAYLNSWGVIAGDQGAGGTWNVTPTAQCVG